MSGDEDLTASEQQDRSVTDFVRQSQEGDLYDVEPHKWDAPMSAARQRVAQ